MFAAPLTAHDDTPVEDKIVVLRGMGWADYQRMLEARGERAVPRLSYLEGMLEVMNPSRPHESLKSRIGRLVEVYCSENDIDFSPYGSWTLEQPDKTAGIEPDECYVFGTESDPDKPDLAIEVIWTSGGLDKLDIYKRLGVREVWFWRRGQLTAHALRRDGYEEVPASEVLPGIDLEEVCRYVDRPIVSQALREYRAALRARAR